MIGFKQVQKVFLLATIMILGNAAQALDNATTSGSNNTSNEPDEVYVLGDIGPHGGKVYFVDQSGEHGLEAKTTDETNLLTWSEAVTSASAYGSGWHLPTKAELKLMYEQKNVLGGFAKNDYWSSTELDSNSAWIQGFFNGDQDRYNKYSKLSVRAVLAF
jgi:Protein of unknown function (DUF1566)